MRKAIATTGAEEVSVYAVNATRDGSDVGSAVVILGKDDTLRWRSEFTPGYGAIGLDSDVTGNFFVRFAVTNHSSVVWALGLQNGAYQNFGTVGGPLTVDDYDNVSDAGAAHLYAAREGWPANSQNKTTSRDVFGWNGQNYTFQRRQVLEPGQPSRIVREYPAGSRQCAKPKGKYSYDLSGLRTDAAPPP